MIAHLTRHITIHYHPGMNTERPDCEMQERLARLEERMNTMQAKYESALERLRSDMADWKTDMADWKTDMERRDKQQILTMIAVIAIGLTVHGFLTAS